MQLRGFDGGKEKLSAPPWLVGAWIFPSPLLEVATVNLPSKATERWQPYYIIQGSSRPIGPRIRSRKSGGSRKELWSLNLSLP